MQRDLHEISCGHVRGYAFDGRKGTGRLSHPSTVRFLCLTYCRYRRILRRCQRTQFRIDKESGRTGRSEDHFRKRVREFLQGRKRSQGHRSPERDLQLHIPPGIRNRRDRPRKFLICLQGRCRRDLLADRAHVRRGPGKDNIAAQK